MTEATDLAIALTILSFLVQFLPLLALLGIAVVAPCTHAKNCRSEWKWCKKLNKLIIYFTGKVFSFLKSYQRDADSTPQFIVYRYLAPVCYTYFLFYVFVIICTNSIVAFLVGLLQTEYDQVLINFLDGIESCVTYFTASWLSMAFVTWVMLKISKGKKAGCRVKPFLCVWNKRVVGTIAFQAIAVLSYLVVYIITLVYHDRFDYTSAQVLRVAFTIVYLSMFTPWCYFEYYGEKKDDSPDLFESTEEEKDRAGAPSSVNISNTDNNYESSPHLVPSTLVQH